MRKKIMIALILLGLNACVFYKETPVTLPDGTVLQVRIADTYNKQEHAWDGQKAPFQKGVLFVFLRDEEQPYWRKNTRLALDVVFIDAQYQITSIETDVQPRKRYTIDAEIPFAFANAKYLLELPAGTVQAHELKVGDQLYFPLP